MTGEHAVTQSDGPQSGPIEEREAMTKTTTGAGNARASELEVPGAHRANGRGESEKISEIRAAVDEELARRKELEAGAFAAAATLLWELRVR